ncbi:MAG: efflux transporter periplasmic adaptor subunit, partial [Janthinobacterium sp.]
ASLKPVSVGDVVEHQYVVNGGLKAGDTVVIEGQERLQPGATAAPQPWKRPAAVAAAPPVSAVR